MFHNNIIFIGGIHGIGKGTICKKITDQFSDLVHISASTLLKWEEISTPENKLVQNFDSTQDRLIKGLKATIEKDKAYLLDGHFCLLNKEGIPEQIEEETFQLINPKAIVVVVEDVNLIYQGLANRDSMKYNTEILALMQKMEVEHAQNIASELEVPFIKISRNDYSKLTEYLLSEIQK